MLWVLALGVVRCWGGSLLGVVRVVAVDVVAVVAGVFWFVLSNNGGLFIHITYASTHIGVHTRELIRLTHSHSCAQTAMHAYECYLCIRFICGRQDVYRIYEHCIAAECIILTTVFGRQE